jgi:SAM-dependent methyltransferase
MVKHMNYSFPHYLLAKQSVDDRALNRHVYENLLACLPEEPVRIIEVGAGIGTMLARLLDWGLLTRGEYVLVDEMSENIEFARSWLVERAEENRLHAHNLGSNVLRLYDETRDVRVSFANMDVFDFVRMGPPPAELLIAHAFLDLLPMPASLRELFTLLRPGGLAWLTINFDGLTSFEPSIDVELDQKIERLYHQTMDTRLSGGDSQAGRHLFSHLRAVGADILAAGASDWVVHAIDGRYPADEAYFLHFILHFFEQSLGGHPGLDASCFQTWLMQRRAQVDTSELVYIAHQTDFLVKLKGE